MNILQEAEKVTNGERQDQYGNPEDSFHIIAGYWATYLDIDIEPLDVAHMMALLKIARMQGQGLKKDNYVDAVGYLAIAFDRILKDQSEIIEGLEME